MGYIIACDFDGTVTAADTIVAIMQKFAPDKSEPILKKVLAQQISVQEGVTDLFQLLESAKKEAIIDYVLNEVELRPGFQQLLDTAERLDIPFYIISGGMHFFIEPILGQFNGIAAVYANEVDFQEHYMKVEWTHLCDEHCESGGCGTCKPSIVRQLSNEKVIAIGDSVTDIKLSQIADILFTTDKLSDYAYEQGIQHIPFETFDEVAEKLKEVTA
ncbi:MtnX-like HAD-IB family phosphatase [Macrococcus carouselicus]|uniref:2-hydroxy-3-keto-5-methylthiopentenyl-1-phosphate phosphatase n=1 Tax=Macrococcus carouselicus TaxID=69969 RepID=A0A9Q8CKA0_9STAP|nr:MtnX-like HAD-IB family phosphatase [Macrococcus carouselicus]TDM00866.1 2-hydroxy-3-keto-5-methylthiopentenyl-1-phosphate phosphatase [Macrococcus carouselicus]